MHRVGRITKRLILSNEICCSSSKRRYAKPSIRHQEPRHLSWQWSARKGAELTKCKDLCFPKVCPKKSFFPRFKKAYIPAEKKSCMPPKKKQTWKEYFSFLMPDPVPKPPLITCRKLQAQRRRACGNPMQCPGYCLNDNCCPPPQEWFGQAVIYAIPSPFPEPIPVKDLRACGPPPPKESPCPAKDACPLPKEELNMNDYAYKKAFSGISACDDEVNRCRPFICKTVCHKDDQGNELAQKLSCGPYSDFKDVKCPELGHQSPESELPLLVCKKSDCSAKPLVEKEVNVEIKKGVCERTTFLKPYKYGEKYPGMSSSRNLHTNLRMSISEILISRAFYSTNHNEKKPLFAEPTQSQLAQSTWLSVESPAFVEKMSYYQPGRSGNGTQSLLAKHMGGSDGSYSPYHAINQNEEINCYEVPDIDPELLKLSEESKKYLKYAETDRDSKSHVTIARMLSSETNKRMIEEAKQRGEPVPIPKKIMPVAGLTKLSLLRPKLPMEESKATFTSSSSDLARKKKQSNNKKKDTICAGCTGVRQAEEEERNPPPKSPLDCKVRPAGKCRGPTRQLAPGESEPDNPYTRHKAKPYSMCNKPRPVVKKEERDYGMPCEKNPKRKFHTSIVRSESTPEFVTLSEIMKSKGMPRIGYGSKIRTNDWDSHTSDSYNETETVPDMKKSKSNEFRIPVDYTSSMAATIRTNKLNMAQANDDWDRPTADSYKDNRYNNFSGREPQKDKNTESPREETDETQDRAKPAIKAMEHTVSLWDSQNVTTKSNSQQSLTEVNSCEKTPLTEYGTKQFGTQGILNTSISGIEQYVTAKTQSKPTKFSLLFDSINNKNKFENTSRESNNELILRGKSHSFINPLEE